METAEKNTASKLAEAVFDTEAETSNETNGQPDAPAKSAKSAEDEVVTVDLIMQWQDELTDTEERIRGALEDSGMSDEDIEGIVESAVAPMRERITRNESTLVQEQIRLALVNVLPLKPISFNVVYDGEDWNIETKKRQSRGSSTRSSNVNEGMVYYLKQFGEWHRSASSAARRLNLPTRDGGDNSLNCRREYFDDAVETDDYIIVGETEADSITSWKIEDQVEFYGDNAVTHKNSGQ